MQRFNASVLVVSKDMKPSNFQHIRQIITETATNEGFYASISEIKVCAKHKVVMYSLMVDLCDYHMLYTLNYLQCKGDCKLDTLRKNLKRFCLESLVLNSEIVELKIDWNKRHV